METSAKSGEKVEETFVDTAKRIHQNILDGRLVFEEKHSFHNVLSLRRLRTLRDHIRYTRAFGLVVREKLL